MLSCVTIIGPADWGDYEDKLPSSSTTTEDEEEANRREAQMYASE